MAIPKATKWYEQQSTFDYFGGDQFSFSPSAPKRLTPVRTPTPPLPPGQETLWGYLKHLWRG